MAFEITEEYSLGELKQMIGELYVQKEVMKRELSVKMREVTQLFHEKEALQKELNDARKLE